jgi:hypothetical protein
MLPVRGKAHAHLPTAATGLDEVSWVGLVVCVCVFWLPVPGVVW